MITTTDWTFRASISANRQISMNHLHYLHWQVTSWKPILRQHLLSWSRTQNATSIPEPLSTHDESLWSHQQLLLSRTRPTGPTMAPTNSTLTQRFHYYSVSSLFNQLNFIRCMLWVVICSLKELIWLASTNYGSSFKLGDRERMAHSVWSPG